MFEIDSGVTVALSSLTIENGNLSDYNYGGVLNNGTLTLTNSTVSGNSAALIGGGISNAGVLTLTNSTVSGNKSGDYGGGIANIGALTLTNSTVLGNFASIISGGIDNQGTLTIKSTLLANNGSARNCHFSPRSTNTSQGYNLSDDNTCASVLTQTGDENNVISGAGLDPSGLQNNGGPTQTIALLPTSPAVDHIPVANCTDTAGNPITTDQRGITRPQEAGCDVGAFELTALTASSDGPFQVNYASNLNLGDSVLNLTNGGGSAGNNTPLVNANSYGDICVNAYVYAPDQELATAVAA